MPEVQKTYNSNSSAVWAGIRDLRDSRKHPYDRLLNSDRLDGKTVLITGASSGLGLAISKNLASRGARVLMVCRRDAARELESVRRAGLAAGGSADVLRADMSDFASIRRLIGELASDGVRLDVTISNAAAVCSSARRTVDGFEEMLQVNALAPALLITGLLNSGVIPNDSFAGNGRKASGRDLIEHIPRIVVVASEAHRSANDLKLSSLEIIEPYGMSESTNRYGWTKLLLLTFTRDLARRLEKGDRNLPDVSVHALCPGPVASNIAREAPVIARPFAKLFFALFFQKPKTAALPAVYLAASPRIEGETHGYQFLMHKRAPSETADSEENGRLLRAKLEQLSVLDINYGNG
jgi:NAD(P)-dependent dehydrogenase (short-subunit alcohol dehydrogenase family)